MGKHGGGAPIPPLLFYYNGTAQKQSLCGRHIMKEHVLAVGSVDGNRRLLHFANWMHKSGKQKMREHLPSGRLTIRAACISVKFHCPINRVQRRVRNRQILPFCHSGAPSAGGASGRKWESIC